MRFMRRTAVRALAVMAPVIATLGLVQVPASAAPAHPVTLQILISGPNTSADHVIIAVNRPGKSSDYPCIGIQNGVRTPLVLDLPVGSWIKVFPADGCYASVGSGKDYIVTQLNEVFEIDLVV